LPVTITITGNIHHHDYFDGTQKSAYRCNNIEHHVASIKQVDISLTKTLTNVTEYQLQQEFYFDKAFRFVLMSKTRPVKVEPFNEAVIHFKTLSAKPDEEVACSKGP
jgi:hypothetical protein